MKVEDVISRVRNISGDITAMQFTDSDVVNWINDGIRECALQNNLLQKRGTQAAVIAQSDYDLPTDVLKMHSVKVNNQKVRMLTLQEFDTSYAGIGADTTSSTGLPEVGYIWAGKLTLFPAPDAEYPIIIDYLYAPALHTTEVNSVEGLQSEISLPVGYHTRIVDYCLAQVAQQDDDITRYQLKMQEFQTGVSALKDQPEWTYDAYPSIGVSPRDMGDYYAEDGY